MPGKVLSVLCWPVMDGDADIRSKRLFDNRNVFSYLICIKLFNIYFFFSSYQFWCKLFPPKEFECTILDLMCAGLLIRILDFSTIINVRKYLSELQIFLQLEDQQPVLVFVTDDLGGEDSGSLRNEMESKSEISCSGNSCSESQCLL